MVFHNKDMGIVICNIEQRYLHVVTRNRLQPS